MATGLWTKEQVKLAFHLYCQLPYGRIHGRNPEIIALSKIIGRTADAVAMKMLNIASNDPVVKSAGKAALGNASALDLLVWDEFHADWERLALECHQLMQQYGLEKQDELQTEEDAFFTRRLHGRNAASLDCSKNQAALFPPGCAEHLPWPLLHVRLV